MLFYSYVATCIWLGKTENLHLLLNCVTIYIAILLSYVYIATASNIAIVTYLRYAAEHADASTYVPVTVYSSS